MRSALGVLNWSPREFWAASLYEYSVAVEGYMHSKGVKIQRKMTKERFEQLKRLDEQRGNNT